LAATLADHRLERTNVCLDLHQHDLVVSVEPEVRRPAPRTGDRSLDGRMPARVELPQDSFDERGMSRVVDQRRPARIDGDPEIATERAHCPGPDPRGDVRVALFHPTDDRA
jgi:hypothetical protein